MTLLHDGHAPLLRYRCGPLLFDFEGLFVPQFPQEVLGQRRSFEVPGGVSPRGAAHWFRGKFRAAACGTKRPTPAQNMRLASAKAFSGAPPVAPRMASNNLPRAPGAMRDVGMASAAFRATSTGILGPCWAEVNS